MELFLSQLGNCQDTSQILDLTLAQAIRRDLGIKTIRYYRLRRIKGEEHLVSVDAAGHSPFVTTQLRLGSIEKVRRKAHEVRKDGSFDVIDTKGSLPFVFQINPDLEEDAIRSVHLAPLPFYELWKDNCNTWLGDGRTRDAWVEVPLRLGGRILGKLACDLDVGRIEPATRLPLGLASRLIEFQTLSSYLTPFLESLRGLEVNGPLEEAGREIFSCATYEKLYEYCTTELIKLYPFDYESADILVVTRDTLKGYEYPDDRVDSETLVLRGSSCELIDIKEKINVGFYRRDPVKFTGYKGDGTDPEGEQGHGLTPWVWRRGKPLQLNHKHDDPKFEEQLRAYEPDEQQLRWVEHIKAGVELKSLLIVPIPAPSSEKDKQTSFPRAEDGPWGGRRVVGVIRFANKRNGYIEPREVVLLQRIAERCLGPKLMALRHETFALNLRDKLDKLNLLQLDTADANTSTSDQPSMEMVLAQALGEFLSDLEGKLVLVNLRTNATKIRSLYVGGDLAGHTAYQGEKDLEHTLTEYLIHNVEKQKTGYVFLNDLEYAERKGHYTKDEPEAICALASPIHFQGVAYGGLIVLSKQYNILPASYGQLIQVMAGHIGFLLSRRAAYEFSTCIEGLRHDSQHWTIPMHDLFWKAANGQFDKSDQERCAAVVDFWCDTIFTYCQTGPTPIDIFVDDCKDEIDIADRVNAAAVEAWKVCKGEGDPQISMEMAPGLRARVNAPYLTVCLFNLMKNAWQASGLFQIAVSVEVKDNRLFAHVTNICPYPDPARIDRLRDRLGRGLPPPVRAIQVNPDAGGLGLRLVQRLAEWHRLPGEHGASERRGDLTVEAIDDLTIQFVLQLPILIKERGA